MKKILRLLVLLLFVGLFVVSGCNKTDKYDYLVLVNKYSQLPDDWEKNVELVDAKNAWDEDIKVEKNAYENYLKLEKALEKEGVNIELDSVYRSVKAQQDLWDEWSADPEKGIDYVRKTHELTNLDFDYIPSEAKNPYLNFALSHLDKDLKEIFLMKTLLGYTTKKVAEVLNLTPKMVNYAYEKARKQLRKELEGVEDEIK